VRTGNLVTYSPCGLITHGGSHVLMGTEQEMIYIPPKREILETQEEWW